MNPADKLSRGISFSQKDVEWLSGPSFFKQPEYTWSTVEVEVNKDEIEHKKKVALTNLVSEVKFWHKLWQRYSRWKSLIRAVSWLTRFKVYWMLMNTKNQKGTLTVGSLPVRDMHLAEIQLIKATQEQCFSTDMNNLMVDRKIRSDSSLRKLNPFISNGVLRIRSRLTHADLVDDVKYSIILPQKHHITDLIIGYYHEREGLAGYAHVLASMRRRFWVIHGAASIKRNLRLCLTCP